MKSICGADCNNCGYGKNNKCKGCTESKGCPFGKQCFVYKYIKNGGTENFGLFKKQLIDEFNSLNVPGMPKIDDLFPINGAYELENHQYECKVLASFLLTIHQ